MNNEENQNIFKNRNFLKLWLAQVLAHPAGHILNFILIIKVYQLSHSSFTVSLLLALSVAPPILFSAFGGILADSHSRKLILILTNLSRGLFVTGFIFFGGNLWAIFILLFINTLITQFYLPAENASIPQTVNPSQLFLANSFFMFILYVSFLIGYALAGPILHYLGEKNTYFILIAMYGIAGLIDIFLPDLKPDKPVQIASQPPLAGWRYIKERITDSFSFIKDNKIVIFIGSQLLFILAIQRSVVSLLPELADQILFFDVKQISYYLISPVAIGAFLGGIIANRLKFKLSKQKIIVAGIILDAVFLLLLPYASLVRDILIQNPDRGQNIMIIVVAFLAFLSGVANVLIIISAQTYLHEQTSNQQRGRIFGNFYTLMNLLILPTVLLTGWVASRFSVESTFLVLGIITSLVAISVWLYGRRHFKII